MSNGFDSIVDISEYDFSKESLLKISGNIWVKNQWPLVYFIKNEKEKIAYVGETTHALNRINNHLANKQREGLDKISVIGCDKFNKSATLDIEAQLIQYLVSEGTFRLQNGNNGLSNHVYYQQALYRDLLKQVWRKLLQKKVVHKSLEDIENSNFFKYSPYKSLNEDQLNSVIEIIASLNKKTSAHIFVSGSAGTGKTILATYLIKLLTSPYEDLNFEDIENENFRELALVKEFKIKYPNPSIALVVAMTSLRETLQKVFDTIPGLHKGMVISPTEAFRKKYDLLIVDEAHRLRQRRNISFMGVFTENNKKLGLDNSGTELDWILRNSTHQIFFYDAEQTVKPSDVPGQRFTELLEKPSTIKLALTSQMRVSAGSDYITFVDNLLNCKLYEAAIKFEPLNYELRVFESFTEMYAQLSRREEAFRLCRLIAGYSWPWVSKGKKKTRDYDIEIEGLKFCWNSTTGDWISSKNSFHEIGSIHTTQGYELNFTGVIFGKEITYNPSLGKIEIHAENYFDKNGKKGISDPEELKAFIINIYKNMLYRGRRGTFIYACDPALRKYLHDSIHGKTVQDTSRILPMHEVDPYVNSIPLYDISVAAGNFSEPQLAQDTQWITLPERHVPGKDLFACKIVGESMNKLIPNESICLFRKDTGGSREEKIVLVEHSAIQDADFGSGFTIKQYHSKKITGENTWRHQRITLKPQSNNPSYKNIVLEKDDASRLKVIGIFVTILKI